MYKRVKECYQPKYNPDKWNKNDNLRRSHNCYSYFLNDISEELIDIFEGESNQNQKILNPQPGHYCGMTKYVNIEDTTCESINKRVLCDNPDIFIISDHEECPKNYYKGGLRVNEKDMYHFYRQDNDGTWSHKDGGRNATNKDQYGNIIKDIKEMETSKYKTFCNYYCVPNNSYKKTNMGRNKRVDGSSWYKN
tara:strand:- start:145 stop:723 length:579 start_codon:yes stop_codon:yes gene_type:complete